MWTKVENCICFYLCIYLVCCWLCWVEASDVNKSHSNFITQIFRQQHVIKCDRLAPKHNTNRFHLMTPGQTLNLRSILNIYSKRTNPSLYCAICERASAALHHPTALTYTFFLMACLHWVSEISVDTVVTDVRGRNTGVDSIWCLVLVETGLEQIQQITLVWLWVDQMLRWNSAISEKGWRVESFNSGPAHYWFIQYHPASTQTLQLAVCSDLGARDRRQPPCTGAQQLPSPPGLHWRKTTHTCSLCRQQGKGCFCQWGVHVCLLAGLVSDMFII